MIFRKGITMPNLLSAIIAIIIVISVGGLIYKGGVAYADQEDNNARDALESLVGKIEAMEVGSENTFLINFPKEESSDRTYGLRAYNTDEERPEACTFENCLCICPDPNSVDTHLYDSIWLRKCSEANICSASFGEARLEVIGSVKPKSVINAFKVNKGSDLISIEILKD